MSKISAIIITKNEEAMIADCIDSVQFCDEIIVIDSHSTDRTADIANRMECRVFPVELESFAQRRNFGLSRAKYEWILYIDADERISPELAQEIKAVVQKNELVFAAFKVQRKNFYLGNNEWPYIETLERLFLKKQLKEWRGDLHESPIITGKIGILAGFLYHYTHRDLSQMVDKTNTWSVVEADLRLRAHHPQMSWWRFPRVMITAFIRSYILQNGWKLGTVGLIESMYQAFSSFITYAKLWELQQNGKKKV